MTGSAQANGDTDTSRELAAILVSRWPPGAAPADEALGQHLAEAHKTAAEAWPDLGIAAPPFIAYLAERLDPSRPPAEALAEIQMADLYLACACAARVPAALAIIESQYLPALGPVLSRFDPSPAFADEVLQLLRIRLLVGAVASDRLPAILQYRGRGPLRNWLAVVATRTAMMLKGQSRPGVSLDEAVLHASLDSPELQSLRSLYLDDLRELTREAVAETLAAMGPEARNLMRWHLVEGVSLRKIAAVRGTYVMAVAREYARIRAAIQDRIREKAQVRMGLATREADSLVQALASRISLSISRLFEDRPDP